MMKHTLKAAVAAAVVGGVAALMAAPAANATQGRYWESEAGSVWRSGFGACYSSRYGPQGYTPACDPESKVQAAPEEKIEVAVLETPEPTYTSVELNTVTLFEFDSAKLTPEGVEAIRQVANRARNAQRIDRIEVVGHTDSTGSAQYNQKLSERRAEAVMTELAKAELDPGTTRARGYGEGSPAASNATREGRRQNRRVDVEILAVQ